MTWWKHESMRDRRPGRRMAIVVPEELAVRIWDAVYPQDRARPDDDGEDRANIEQWIVTACESRLNGGRMIRVHGGERMNTMTMADAVARLTAVAGALDVACEALDKVSGASITGDVPESRLRNVAGLTRNSVTSSLNKLRGTLDSI